MEIVHGYYNKSCSWDIKPIVGRAAVSAIRGHEPGDELER
jgi:hypothetical protein